VLIIRLKQDVENQDTTKAIKNMLIKIVGLILSSIFAVHIWGNVE